MMLVHVRAVGLVLVCASIAAPAVLAGEVLVVDAGGGGDHTSIQAAVDAAVDGDLILVRPGGYGGFAVSNKGLAIVADGGPVIVGPQGVVLQGTLVEHTIVLAGLELRGYKDDGVELAALRSSLTRGAVRVEDCVIRGGNAGPTDCWDGCPAEEVAGGVAVALERALDVAFVRCQIVGGEGRDCLLGSANAGGRGVRAIGSSASFLDCLVRGGEGGGQCSFDPGGLADGGLGGTAMYVQDDGTLPGFVHLAGSFVRGGDGGDGGGCIDLPGRGGDGLILNGQGAGGVDGLRLDTGIFAGANGCGPSVPPGIPLSIFGNASLTQLSGEAPGFRIATPGPLQETGPMTLSFEGPAGDRVRVVRGERPGYAPRPALWGVLFLEPTGFAQPVFEGQLPASGQLSVTLPAPKLPPGEEGTTLHLQAIFGDPLSGVRLASPASPALTAR